MQYSDFLKFPFTPIDGPVLFRLGHAVYRGIKKAVLGHVNFHHTEHQAGKMILRY